MNAEAIPDSRKPGIGNLLEKSQQHLFNDVVLVLLR